MVREATSTSEAPSGGLLGAAELIGRLAAIQKRKRAFGGQVVDMEAIRRSVLAERRQSRPR